jgi:drug/metabolite transporter (DMT)-like permease
MADAKPVLPVKRRELPKNQAIAVMVIGAILFGQAFFFSTESGSSAHTAKNMVALIGLVIFFVGVYLRPMKPDSGQK